MLKDLLLSQAAELLQQKQVKNFKGITDDGFIGNIFNCCIFFNFQAFIEIFFSSKIYPSKRGFFILPLNSSNLLPNSYKLLHYS